MAGRSGRQQAAGDPARRAAAREQRYGADKTASGTHANAEPRPSRSGIGSPASNTAAPGRAGAALATGRRVAGQELACGWCGRPVTLRATGRPPKWCSATCRQRAWEQTRAAASGRSAVQIVERYVAAIPIDVSGWLSQLATLTHQVSTQPGQFLDGDLDNLAHALELGLAAIAARRDRSTAMYRY
jgi:hypothetical protein